MSDPFDLERFVRAQAPVFSDVTAELRAGRKRTHWMWFVFPQHRSLGRSATASRYGIASHAEAAAYAQHPVLGPRLRACCEHLLMLQGATAHDIFGSPDDLKLCSSMTLFAQAAPHEALFAAVLQRYFDGQADTRTLELLQ